MKACSRSIEYLCLSCGSQGVTNQLTDVPPRLGLGGVICCPACGCQTRLTRTEAVPVLVHQPA